MQLIEASALHPFLFTLTSEFRLMDSLNLPSILSPDLGLLFWMLIAFLVVFGLLAKFGFPVITSMVEERKKFID